MLGRIFYPILSDWQSSTPNDSRTQDQIIRHMSPRQTLTVLPFSLPSTRFARPPDSTRLPYADLVHRLYDLTHLAETPAPGEKSGSWTSADREAIYNARTGRYEKWWANGDGSGFIRREGDGAVVAAEIQGPGVIWRVWSCRL